MGNRNVKIGRHLVGEGYPVYKIAEIGINHNGEMQHVEKLIHAAREAGFHAVKFQKRTPDLCVPEARKGEMRKTPWGDMTYLEYRYRVELGKDDYVIIDKWCRDSGLDWFASCWDIPSVEFMENFSPVCYKVASASVTDHALLYHIASKKRPVILSTGMSTMDDIEGAVSILGRDNLILTHAVGAYPCATTELNLQIIKTLKKRFGVDVGYSGHEEGLWPTTLAVALGAVSVERHITLSRDMWGSDQAASLTPRELVTLSSRIDEASLAMGDGIKRIYDSERKNMDRLRSS